MPTNRTVVRRPHRGELNHTQLLELWLGPPREHGSAFGSREELHQAWVLNREQVMARAGIGRRPMAWWEFDAGDLRFPGLDCESSTPYAANLLTADETTELMQFWRTEYGRANAPGFFYCEGPGKIFRGAEARRRHYEWSDIPHSLIAAWSAQADASVLPPAL